MNDLIFLGAIFDGNFFFRSYEDSLQSVPHRKCREASVNQMTPTSSKNMAQRRSRNRSITEDIVHPGGLHRMQSLTHLPAAPAAIFIPGPSALRRSTERLMMTCPLNP